MKAFKSGLEVGEVIGHGHFGNVHLGKDSLHPQVAVKVLHPFPDETSKEWDARKEDLLGEAQKLKAAEHKNVVRILNVCRADDDDMLHMVTEYCDGGSVFDSYEDGPMTLAEVRAIATHVCLGLDAIHKRGMLHRDIKPGNILKSGRLWKIADFGLVSDDMVQGYASLAGYEDHVAPESWKDHVTSFKTDVWAMGMTIYRLLHGHAFYKANFRMPNSVEVAEDVKRGGFALRLPWLHHIPTAWRRFIRKAMHDNTKQRIPTAFALGQALAGLPIEPEWNCQYSATDTVWKRTKLGRRHVVTWTAQSPKKHLWTAINSGGERSRTMGGVSIPIDRKHLDADLDAFFAQAH